VRVVRSSLAEITEIICLVGKQMDAATVNSGLRFAGKTAFLKGAETARDLLTANSGWQFSVNAKSELKSRHVVRTISESRCDRHGARGQGRCQLRDSSSPSLPHCPAQRLFRSARKRSH
jgi:hypothetical protein